MAHHVPETLRAAFIGAAAQAGFMVRMIMADGSVDWIGDAPQDTTVVEILATLVRSQRAAAISGDCRRRIYSIASAESQMNISGAAALISAKPTEERTAEDIAFLAAFSASVQWIADMRATVETLRADAEADYLADASWPTCPLDVIELVARF